MWRLTLWLAQAQPIDPSATALVEESNWGFSFVLASLIAMLLLLLVCAPVRKD